MKTFQSKSTLSKYLFNLAKVGTKCTSAFIE